MLASTRTSLVTETWPVHHTCFVEFIIARIHVSARDFVGWEGSRLVRVQEALCREASCQIMWTISIASWGNVVLWAPFCQPIITPAMFLSRWHSSWHTLGNGTVSCTKPRLSCRRACCSVEYV